MDRLDELAIFVAIVETGSLVGAARRLRQSTPAVTRALAQLEKRLGVRLAERTTRRLSLTEAGRAFVERSRTVLADYDAAFNGLTNAPVRGLLRVTAPVPFGRMHVAPLVACFLDAFPELRIEVIFSDHNLDLVADGIDVALRIGALADSTLVARKVGEVTRVTVASPDYLHLHGAPQTPTDLVGHDLLFGALPALEREWHFGMKGRGAGLRLSPKLRINDVESVLHAARAGRGIARPLSYQVMDDLAAGRLVRVLRKFEREPVPVQLVTPSAIHMSPKTRAFVEYASGFFRTLTAIHIDADNMASGDDADSRL